MLLAWSALANLPINAVFFVAILRLVRAGFHPAEIGLVSTAAGVGGILGAIAAPTIIDRLATGRLTVVIAWSFVPLLVPLVFWNNPLVVGAALFAGLLLNPAGNAGISAYSMALTPEPPAGPGDLGDPVPLDVGDAARAGGRRRSCSAGWADPPRSPRSRS